MKKLEDSQCVANGVEIIALDYKSGISSACVIQLKSSEENQNAGSRGVKPVDERDDERMCVIQYKQSEDSQSVASEVEIVTLENKSSMPSVFSNACVMQLKSSEESHSVASRDVNLIDERYGETSSTIQLKKSEFSCCTTTY